DVRKLKVRNRHGDMVPLGTVAEVREISGPLVLTRYNMYPAAAINGNVASGFSTGQAIEAMEALASKELPLNMASEWTEITYLERTSTNTGMVIFALSVVFVFLVLAALYESWSLPLAVILVVPMCVLGSIAGVAYVKQDINIFTQIGFVVLIGLACKNAILIVEFAQLRRLEGTDAREATLAACELRLRPILMTSFAFILGVVPLVWAYGAGAEMRRALGVAVFSGMLGVTAFGVFLTPVFFYVIERLRNWSSAFLQRRSQRGRAANRRSTTTGRSATQGHAAAPGHAESSGRAASPAHAAPPGHVMPTVAATSTATAAATEAVLVDAVVAAQATGPSTGDATAKSTTNSST
ncbi:MAG TPA: efflux RND transporter permease subunit, partial [Pirellulaceae bacterium]|nr:efflux RND transporter permease subunit [Pirellulaceae bacterium]